MVKGPPCKAGSDPWPREVPRATGKLRLSATLLGPSARACALQREAPLQRTTTRGSRGQAPRAAAREGPCAAARTQHGPAANSIQMYWKHSNSHVMQFHPFKYFFFFFSIFMICVTTTTVYFRTFFPSKRNPFCNQPLSPHFVSLVVQKVKNPPAMKETSVGSLGWEDPVEEGTATHSSILAWRIPWTEEPGGLQSLGSQRVQHDWATDHISPSPLTLSNHESTVCL